MQIESNNSGRFTPEQLDVAEALKELARWTSSASQIAGDRNEMRAHIRGISSGETDYLQLADWRGEELQDDESWRGSEGTSYRNMEQGYPSFHQSLKTADAELDMELRNIRDGLEALLHEKKLFNVPQLYSVAVRRKLLRLQNRIADDDALLEDLESLYTEILSLQAFLDGGEPIEKHKGLPLDDRGTVANEG